MIRRPATLIAAVAAAAVATLPASALAADPGRWFALNDTEVPLTYDRGMASTDEHLFFGSLPAAGYRTDHRLGDELAAPQLLPADLVAQGYDRLGDWTATGDRVIAPIACAAAPPAAAEDQPIAPGEPNPNAPCPGPALGILSPELGWLGRVPLNPTDVTTPLTWAEADPDGDLVWTSSGEDLVAYDAATIQPGETAIRPARRLTAAAPEGITGAAFDGDRLFVATQGEAFEIWSIDLDTGDRQLEIQRPWNGRSAGLDVVDALGGELHWLVAPDDPQGFSPTFGTGRSTIVSFVRREDAVVQLSAKPAKIPVGVETEVKVKAFLTYLDSDHVLRGARVSGPGDGAFTNRKGKATLLLTAKEAGRIRLIGTKPPVSGGRTYIRAVAPKP